MHIGLVSPAWPVDELPNGISTYVHNIRAELIAQGHRVSVFCNLLGATNRDSGVHLVEAPLGYRIRRKFSGLEDTKSYNLLHWGRPLASTINAVHRRDPIDIIEMDEFWGWCAVVRRLVSVPVLVKLHGPAFLDLIEEERQGERARLRIAREGDGLRCMPAIVSPSRTTLDDTVRHYDLRPEIRAVLPNPVIFPREDQLWQLRRCDQRTILFVGRFDKRKGGDTVLRAFHKLLAAHGDLKLIFVGPDLGLTSGDGPRISYEQFTNTLFSETQRRSISYLGKMPPDAISDIRRSAMLTIVASRWENQPNTLLEAMAHSCPVVAVDAGGVNEILEDGVSGVLAPPDDVDGLCRKIEMLLSEREAAEELGRKGRKAVLDRHAVHNLAAENLRVYREAIALARKAG